VQKAFPPTFLNGRWLDPARSGVTGKALLDDLSQIANKRGAPGMRAAEPALKEAGIPGIRYLDGGSRGAGAGTSNYVVFPGNEGLLNILERNGQPLGLLDDAAKPAYVAPGAKRMEIAQRNAAKPISEGGLGLGPKNTAAERAKALGFDTEAFHGTDKAVEGSLRRSKTGAQGPGVYLGDDASVANAYAGDQAGANVVPTLLRGDFAGNKRFSDLVNTHGWSGAEEAGKKAGLSGIHDTMFESAFNVWDPKNIRSRFAAFDPARRNESNLLGRADPLLLGLLGIGAGGLTYLGSDK
jgi:hypothetical protein